MQTIIYLQANENCNRETKPPEPQSSRRMIFPDTGAQQQQVKQPIAVGK